MRFAPSLVLLTALASCAPPLPIADYIADARSPNAKITTQPLRFDVITIRSFVAGHRQERPGARCHIFTPDQRLSAAFQTPAQVRVPIYKGAPAPINGYCQMPDTNLAPALRSKRSINLLPKTKGCGSHWAAAGRALQAQFPCVTAAKTAMPIRRSCASHWHPKGPLATPAQYRPKPALHEIGVQIRQNHPPQSPRASAA